MPLSPADYRKTAYTHRTGLFSARPAANTVLPGTLYFCEDRGVLYRSNGTTWTLYSSPSPVPAMPPLYEFDESDKEIALPNGNIYLPSQLIWRDVPYASGDYTASAGNWTVDSGDVLYFYYTLVEDFMVVVFTIVTTSVSATPEKLKIKIPAGKTAVKRADNFGFASDNGGTSEPGTITVNDAGTTIDIGLLDGTNWATATNATAVVGEIILRVNK